MKPNKISESAKVFIIFFYLIISQKESLSSISKESVNPSYEINNNIDTKNIFNGLKVVSLDLKFGKAFSSFKKKLQRKRLDEKKIKKLLLLSRMSYSFKNYGHILKKAKKISSLSLKNYSHFYTSCKFEETIKYSIFKEVNLYLKNYCHHFFLKLLYLKDGAFLLKKRNFDYLSKNLNHYLKQRNNNLFSIFLKKLKKETNVHFLISNLITSFYKSKGTKPPRIIHNEIISLNDPSFILPKEKNKNTFHEKNKLKKYFNKINFSFKKFSFEKSKNLVVEALSHYFKHNKVIDKKYAWKRFTNIGKKFLHRDHYDFATSIFKTANIFHPKKKENESLFLILWSHLLRKDYRGAQNFILKENLIERFAQLNSKLRFWVALSLKKNGEKALAKNLYKEIISLNPLSFYSIISLKELNKSSKQNKEDQIIGQDSSPLKKELKIKSFRPHFINSLRRLLVWIKLKNYNLELKEIESLIGLEPNHVYKFPQKVGLNKKRHEKFLFIEIVKFLTDRGKHLRSFKLIQKSLTFKKFILNQQYLEILFPFEYFSQIKKIDDSIDPIIILSLIRQESAFNPKAISRVGARGLMQIMPSTAKTIKKRVTRSQLKNPQLNLKIGIKYFKKLLSKYKGNLIYTLAAYNAGESRIATWKKKIFSSEDPLSIIESIPFKETRNYVKLIYRNIFFYKWLEKKSNLAVPLKDSFIISF